MATEESKFPTAIELADEYEKSKNQPKPDKYWCGFCQENGPEYHFIEDVKAFRENHLVGEQYGWLGKLMEEHRQMKGLREFKTGWEEKATFVCPGRLNIKGEDFPCDWEKPHGGWGHSNRESGAIWVGNEGSQGG